MEANEERERRERELQKEREEQLLKDCSDRDVDVVNKYKEQLEKNIRINEKDLNSKLGDAIIGEEAIKAQTYALYDNGDLKSKANQMVKRIELDDNLTEAEKEQLLRNHEFNLTGIDGIMNEERKIQDQSLEKAIKDRLERRQRLLEKRNKKEIKNEAIKVE
mmetsp:Transcript_7555/g.5444  ORF Transcript_7555/g.5444 Transcript_7555/m.5444 type:complete len:162 (-) Transcript_7555:2519-3004(-)